MDSSRESRRRASSRAQAKPRKSDHRRSSRSGATERKTPTIDTSGAGHASALAPPEEWPAHPPSSEPSKKVNELISEEERARIDSHYYLDLASVDRRKVQRSILVDEKIFRCRLCRKAYARLDKCQVHLWRHYSMLPYVCRACDFKTLTITGMRGHVRKFHLKLKPFKCDRCDKSYTVGAMLKEHMNTHTDSQPYRCDNCDYACLNKRVLIAHLAKHKSEKDILCDICGKEFYSAKKMRAHRNIHKESNALKCDICFVYVSTEKALRRHHANVHTKDYICEFCNKRWTTRKALHNHVYQVHSEGRHQCPMCPNVYKNGAMLQDHILKHQGIRKYKCKICGKAFTQRTHLTAHMAVHGEKRHECPGCHKGFNRQDNMKVHTRNCTIFLANPGLAKLMPQRRSRTSINQNNTLPVLKTNGTVNIIVAVEPTLHPDVNIKVEPTDGDE